jgi:hypothetical protein
LYAENSIDLERLIRKNCESIETGLGFESAEKIFGLSWTSFTEEGNGFLDRQ